MPKITIREIDNTGAETSEYLDYTVLVPGIALIESAAESGEEQTYFSGLITDKSAFDSLTPLDYTDLGYLTAVEFVKRGLSVYYKSAYTVETVENEKSIELIDAEDYDELFAEFVDKGKYDLRFITIGGLPELDEGTDHAEPKAYVAALRCAGDRGDAVAVMSVPKIAPINDGEGNYTLKEILKNSKDIDAWVQQEFKTVAMESITRTGVSWKTTTETYGTYGAIFTPSINTKIYVNKVNTPVELPGWFNYIATFAKFSTRFPEWFATSGSIRGVSPYDITTNYDFGDADVDILQKRSVSVEEDKNHIATNVVCTIRPYGKVIWGARTMHPLSKPQGSDTYGLQASSFLNIRQACCILKKTLYRASRRYTFEPNSDILWVNFKSAITPLLDEMKENQGIDGYQILRQKTNKKALLVARIIITPVEPLEDFDLTVEMSDTIEIAE